MSQDAFRDHRQAALTLLSTRDDLPLKTAGFLGHVCVTSVLSLKQRDWLDRLLRRNGLPPLAD